MQLLDRVGVEPVVAHHGAKLRLRVPGLILGDVLGEGRGSRIAPSVLALAPPAVEGGTVEGTDEFIAAYLVGRIIERGVDGAGACLSGYLARGGFQP